MPHQSVADTPDSKKSECVHINVIELHSNMSSEIFLGDSKFPDDWAIFHLVFEPSFLNAKWSDKLQAILLILI